jgi:hypothetical protein
LAIVAGLLSCWDQDPNSLTPQRRTGETEMTKSITIMSLTAVLALAVSVQATVLVNETFSHADGALVGNTPEIGGTWTAHSGVGNLPIQVSSGAAELVQGNNSRQDDSTAFANTTSGKLYYGFDFSVTDDGTGTFDEYFAHFKDSGSDFTARMHIDPATGGGDYTVGISGTDASPEATWATDLTFGTTYRAIAEYDFTTDVSTLWIDATSTGDTSIVAGADAVPALEAFALRQSTAAGETITVDNLIVATTFAEAVPEPASWALIGLGAIAVLRRRR